MKTAAVGVLRNGSRSLQIALHVVAAANGTVAFALTRGQYRIAHNDEWTHLTLPQSA